MENTTHMILIKEMFWSSDGVKGILMNTFLGITIFYDIETNTYVGHIKFIENDKVRKDIPVSFYGYSKICDSYTGICKRIHSGCCSILIDHYMSKKENRVRKDTSIIIKEIRNFIRQLQTESIKEKTSE